MARPPRQSSNAPLSPGQAHYVLEQLIKERRVSPGEVSRYVSDMGREISDLESRLQRLRDAHGGGASSSAAAPAPAKRGPGRPPGSGAKRGPGRPPGRPGRPPGRPPASANTAGAAAAPAAAKGGAKKAGRKAKAAITPEQLASRQLQGRYLGLVRRFPESKRSYYAKVAKEKGREAAIKEMVDANKK